MTWNRIRTCAVTGATGFIGTALCRHLEAAGWQVRRIVRQPLPAANAGAWQGAATDETQRAMEPDLSGGDAFGPPPCHPAEGKTAGMARVIGPPGKAAGAGGSQLAVVPDLRDDAALGAALHGIDVLFHLAGIAHTSGAEQDALRRVNIAGTRHVMQAAARAGVNRALCFSSSQVAAAERGSIPMTPYIESKRDGERVTRAVAADTGMAHTILRPAQVHGRGMKGNLAVMLRLTRLGLLPPLPPLPGKISLIGLDDLCAVAALAAIAPAAANATLAVTDGRVYSVNALQELLWVASGRGTPRWHCPAVLLFAAAAVGEVTRRAGLIRRGGLASYRALHWDQAVANDAGRLLGYAATQRFEDTLRAIARAASANRGQRPAAAKSHAKERAAHD